MTADIFELRKLAASIPSQGGREIGLWLERHAAWVPEGSAIVEVGSWLGAGTAFLALGAITSGAKIHVFDRFRCASEEEQYKAKAQGLELQIGQDTFPLVRKWLDQFPVNIEWNQGTFNVGKPTRWDGGKVGLYVDDLTKTEEKWNHAMHLFMPHFIHGETVLILMDFWFGEVAGWAFDAQKRWMEAHKHQFESIGSRWAWQTVEAFRYL